MAKEILKNDIDVRGAYTSSNAQVIEVNSATTALRVTQRGTGDALVVEDSTNPDSTPFVINQFGQIISGSLSAWNATAGLQLISDSNNAPNANLLVRRNSNDNVVSIIGTYKARGTQNSPLDVESNDYLGNVVFAGYLDGIFRNAGSIRCIVDGIPVTSLSSVPGALVFSTTLSGSNTQTEKMRITHDGNVGIGTNSPTDRLTVVGNTTLSGLHLVYSTETKATPSISTNTLTLDLASASFFSVNLNAPITTFTLTNVPASPKVYSFTLQFVADGTARAVTWPTGTRWAGGTNPTLTSTANKVDTFTFLTHDGGTNWFAFISNQNQ